MPDAPSAYPLAWPTGRPRTLPHKRRRNAFGTQRRTAPDAISWRPKPLTLAEARKRLTAQIDLLGARLPVLSSNVELRNDGQPRSGRPAPVDPGVALYFRLNDKPTVLACDAFDSVPQNIAAIAATIDAMRRIERYGATTTAQVFTGFLALPAPMIVDDWRAALGNPETLAEAEAAYRERMRRAHPDGGGTHAEAAKLNGAISLAREALRD